MNMCESAGLGISMVISEKFISQHVQSCEFQLLYIRRIKNKGTLVFLQEPDDALQEE